MTLEEKRQRIYDYCEMQTHSRGCELCALIDWCDTYYPGNADKKELEQALNIMDDDLNKYRSLITKVINDYTGKNADIMIVDEAVNHPSHYTDGNIEVIEYIEDKKLGYCLGNAVKYISRAGKKDKAKEIEDLKKARWYITRRIEELEKFNVKEK